MAPELRKRKAPPPAPEPPAKKPAAKSKVTKAAEKVKEAITGEPAKAAPKGKANGSAASAAPAVAPVNAPAPAKSAGGKPVVGEIINLDGFGGEIETNDGTKTTLKALVDESKAGVVLFTYPKASTPGCKTFSFLSVKSYGTCSSEASHKRSIPRDLMVAVRIRA
jgi:peroxiredoxin Q/BCP